MKSPGFLVYLILYLFSMLLVVSFEDWFLVWMGLELNMFSFLVLCYDRMSIVSVESSYKYFFIQSMGSGMVLVSVYVGEGMGLVLMFKIGVGPFFFWYVSVVKGMSWISNMFLMVFQSLLPMILLYGVWGVEMWVVAMVSLLVGGVGAFFESSMSGLMAFSSLNHMGWLLVAQGVSDVLWVFYFIVYGVLVGLVVSYFSSVSVLGIFDMMSMGSKDMVYVMMMMSGLPPFVGFFLKLLVLVEVLEVNLGMGMFLVLVSLLMFYIYVRVLYRMLLVSEWSEDEWKGDLYRSFFLMDVVLMLVVCMF